jgi:hypothetical protein
MSTIGLKDALNASGGSLSQYSNSVNVSFVDISRGETNQCLKLIYRSDDLVRLGSM